MSEQVPHIETCAQREKRSCPDWTLIREMQRDGNASDRAT
jgi:hypothetical protein